MVHPASSAAQSRGISIKLLLLAVMAIFCTGLVVVFSTTSAEVLDLELQKNTHHALLKQLMYGGIGTALAFGAYRLGHIHFIRLSPLLLCAFCLCLLLVLVPGIGREVNGSRRWLGFGGFYFQPSEFVKIIVPSFFIYQYLAWKSAQFSVVNFFKLIGFVAIPILLILIEPNNGTAAVIAMTVIMLCFLFRIPFKYWAFPLLASIAIGGAFASQLPYVTARINVYLHPELDLKGKGHQPYQAKIAAGSGQLFGKGPGKSWQKLSYLPEAQNDYIAAIYAEEYGFAGMLVLISCYLLIGCLGFQIANQAMSL